MEKDLKTKIPPETSGCLEPVCLLIALFLLLFSSVGALAGDFQLQPAFKTSHPEKAAIMDLFRTGNRLVAVGERGLVIYSDDNGENWTQAQVPVRVTLVGICFSDPDNGWAIGHETVLLHSRDRGATWEKVMNGDQVNEMMVKAMEGIVAKLKQQLAAAPEDQKQELQPRLEDAQTNLRGFIDTQKEGPVQPLLDIIFTSPREGLIIGAFGIILHTADGGKTWRPLLDRIDNPMGYHFYGLARTRDRLFIFGEAGGLFQSSDNGLHWQALESPYQGSFFSALGDPDGSLAAGFGLRGNVVISYNDGESWKQQQLGRGGALNGGALLSGKRFVLVGMAGEIFLGRTDAPGFKTVNTGFPGCMAAIEAPNGKLILAGLRGIKIVDLNSQAGKEVK